MCSLWDASGIYSTAPLTLINCAIYSNSVSAQATTGLNETAHAIAEGGGLFVSNLTLVNCILRGNSAIADAYVTIDPPQGYIVSVTSLGGGIFSQGSLTESNSIFSANTASSGSVAYGWFQTTINVRGGGQYITGNGANIVNSSFAFNNPDGLATNTNATKVLNSIVWGNVTNQLVGTTNVTYCDIQGGMAGTGNKNANPIFLSSSDLLIVPGSPCINAGDTNAAFTNVFFPPSLGKIHNDMGAHGGPGAGARLRARYNQHMEVVFLGGVPGYNYQIQASTDFLNWQSVEQVPIAHLGDYATFLEPITNAIPFRFYRLNLGP